MVDEEETGSLEELIDNDPFIKRKLMSSDSPLPAHVKRDDDFSKEKKPFLVSLESLLDLHYLYGVAGLLGYGLSNIIKYKLGQNNIFSFNLEVGTGSSDLENILIGMKPLFEICLWFSPMLLAWAGSKIVDAVSSVAYGEMELYDEFDDERTKPEVSLKNFSRSKKYNLYGRTNHRLRKREEAEKNFLKSVEINPSDLHAMLYLCEIESDKFEDKPDIIPFFQRCNSYIQAAADLGSKGRYLYRNAYADGLGDLVSRLVKKEMRNPKDIIAKLGITLLDFHHGQYKSVIKGINEIIDLRLKQAYYKENGDLKKIEVEGKELYILLANILEETSRSSKLYKKAAKDKSRWVREQIFLEAKYDKKTHFISMGPSKNNAYCIYLESLDYLLFIKEFFDYESPRKEVRLTRSINKISKDYPNFITAQPITLFEYQEEDTTRYVLMKKFLAGETLYTKIMKSDKKVPDYVLRTLEFLALFYTKLPPSEFDLKERDYISYIKSWASEAGIEDIFRNGEISEIYSPILETYKNAVMVTSIDPHAKNIIITAENEKIGMPDTELTRMVAIQSELVKLFELIPFNPKNTLLPTSFGDPNIQYVIDLFNDGSTDKKIVFDKKFYLCYLNAIIDLGVSYYSPFSLKGGMDPWKRNMLFKTQNTIEIIKTGFRNFYSEFKEPYTKLNKIVSRMIERNGFK